MKYSNITPEAFTEIFRKMKSGIPIPKTFITENIVTPSRTTNCQFAEDTGSLAMSNRPCKGNRIICHHPQNDGMVTYAKLCNRANCKFYEAKGENI